MSRHNDGAREASGIGTGCGERRRAIRIATAAVVLIVLGMALRGTLVVTTVDAVPTTTGVAIEDRVETQVAECEADGGSPAVNYIVDLTGIATADVICEGRGWVCANTQTTVDCYTTGRFGQLTPAVVPEQRPDTAAPMEPPAQTRPGDDDVAVPPSGGAENPTAGEDETIANQAIADQTGACETFGGTTTVIEQRATATVDLRCSGGVFDGMACTTGHDDSVCTSYQGLTDPEQDPSVPTTGDVAEDPTGTTPIEITFVRVASVAELEDALLAKNPDGGETVVIYNQSGSTVTDNATAQVLICESFGGTSTVYEQRTVGGGRTTVDVYCKGGLLDGKWCANGSGYTICFFRTVAPEDGPQVDPTAGIEAPAGDAPTATVAATEAAPTEAGTVPPQTPPTPSVAPTAVPANPTVVPPSNPPPPRNNNSVPPGESIEPAEPTPTLVVLT